MACFQLQSVLPKTICPFQELQLLGMEVHSDETTNGALPEEFAFAEASLAAFATLERLKIENFSKQIVRNFTNPADTYFYDVDNREVHVARMPEYLGHMEHPENKVFGVAVAVADDALRLKIASFSLPETQILRKEDEKCETRRNQRKSRADYRNRCFENEKLAPAYRSFRNRCESFRLRICARL
ncbi:hypothetical protein GCK72_006607 [Caenorhabditis remanei]|uniref:Uncharacterized protein n=1 Tax=Caenorhabditis remanei TaxID=31234 RepID=A0A6A5HH52_CAERE|nr:hypothetical protein GCK72_006607 [Caenorhabditis remanei]KAF1766649.1 hypothetical protein GCK72_006607 [Caenorhabditis remanei]